MKLRFPKLLTVIIISFASFACASVNLAEPDEDSAAKAFDVADGESNIYIFRSEDVILNTGVSIEVDGKPMGNTGPKTFILATVSPGKHTITATGENTDQLEVETASGENYFVWLEIRIGAFTNHGHLHLVNEDEGKKGVMASKLIK